MNTARIDLHLHLDGSLYLPWAYETSLKRQVIPAGTTFEQYYDMVFAKNTKDHSESITKFALMCAVLQERDDLYQAAHRLTVTLAEKGLYYAEIRFASQQHTDHGLSQKEALQAVIDGSRAAMAEHPEIRIGIINCMMHKGQSAAANWQENLETIAVTGELLGKGAVGLDLAGFENNGDFRDYAPLFAEAGKRGIPYTIHAGEMGVGRHVLDALEMGARRIGHGVNCVQKQEYLEAVLRSQVPLEICVSSNVKRDLNYAAHPVRHLLNAGAKVTINTDNMVFARTDLANEHAQLRALGVSREQLWQCTLNAADAAFCDEETKKWLKARLAEAMPCGTAERR